MTFPVSVKWFTLLLKVIRRNMDQHNTGFAWRVFDHHARWYNMDPAGAIAHALEHWANTPDEQTPPIAQSAPVAQTPEVITHAAPVDPDMMERHRAELARWQRDRSRFVTEYTRELGGIAAARAAFERKCPEPQLGGAVTPAPVEPVLATVPAPVVATPIDEPAPAVGSAMVRVMPISGPASVRIIGKLVDGVRVF